MADLPLSSPARVALRLLGVVALLRDLGIEELAAFVAAAAGLVAAAEAEPGDAPLTPAAELPLAALFDGLAFVALSARDSALAAASLDPLDPAASELAALAAVLRTKAIALLQSHVFNVLLTLRQRARVESVLDFDAAVVAAARARTAVAATATVTAPAAIFAPGAEAEAADRPALARPRPLPPHFAAEISAWVRANAESSAPHPQEIAERRAAVAAMQLELRRLLYAGNAASDVFSLGGSSYEAPRLLAFGSSVTGFGGRGSDVDTCLLLDPATAVALRGADAVYKRLSRTFRFATLRSFEQLEALPHASVPLLRALHTPTRVALDICINSAMGLVNSDLLSVYSRSHPCVVPLGLAVKRWAKDRGCADAHDRTPSSYAWILLCIFFLQRAGLVPVLTDEAVVCACEAEGRRVERRMLAGWAHCFVADSDWAAASAPRLGLQADAAAALPETAGAEPSLGELLVGFFRFAASLTATPTCCVSVRTGGYVDRTSCERAEPEASPSAAAERGAQPVPRPGRGSAPSSRKRSTPPWRLVLEDPFELSHDLGRVLSPEGMLRISHELARAAAAASTTGSHSTGSWSEVVAQSTPEEKAAFLGRPDTKRKIREFAAASSAVSAAAAISVAPGLAAPAAAVAGTGRGSGPAGTARRHVLYASLAELVATQSIAQS